MTMGGIVSALERIAKANEDLITLAKEEKEERELPGQPLLPGIVVCPHCQAPDPPIRNEGGTGNVSEFVLAATCMNCGKMFIAESMGWNTYRDADDYGRRENANG